MTSVMVEQPMATSSSCPSQAHLKSIFDNIQSVKFHDQDYNKILSIESSEGEVVPLERPVGVLYCTVLY